MFNTAGLQVAGLCTVGCSDVSDFDAHFRFCTIHYPDFKYEKDFALR